MNEIKLLPKNLVNKIAAGEVIDRPSSVAKELMENSIDAGADEITLRIKNGGLKEITVIDNGKGISRDDIPLAFTQHATSKVSSEEDLEKISTLGFRGEALASIAAAADVEIHTYNKSSISTLTKIQNSETIINEEKPRTQGTTITISDLFRYIPARKKFLSAEYTEFKHIYNTFVSLALSKPDIKFTLIKDEKSHTILEKSNTKERISKIFNDEFTNKLIEVHFDSPNIKISGYITHPSNASDTTPKQFLFLNSRPIMEKTVFAAVKDAYGTTIPRERKPSYFLFLNINPSEVDVNVHPRKNEVKFSDSRELFKSVKLACDKALQQSLRVNAIKSFSISESTSPADVPHISDNNFKYSNPNRKNINNHTNKDFRSQNPLSQSLKFTQTLLGSNDIDKSEIFLDNNEPIKPYKYIGQVLNTYLLYENDSKLIVVDQHAADERINYEKIETSMKNSNQVNSQPLLVPYTFELPGELKESLIENINEINSMGIEISPLSGDTFQISSIPSFMEKTRIEDTIHSIIEDLKDSSKNNLTQIQSKLLSTIACHGSIRAGDILYESQARKIIEDLMKCKLPYSCPHGRPIIWELDEKQLAKNFERHQK